MFWKQENLDSDQFCMALNNLSNFFLPHFLVHIVRIRCDKKLNYVKCLVKLYDYFPSYFHFSNKYYPKKREKEETETQIYQITYSVTQWWRDNLSPNNLILEPDILIPMWDCSSELKREVNQLNIKLKNDKDQDRRCIEKMCS